MRLFTSCGVAAAFLLLPACSSDSKETASNEAGVSLGGAGGGGASAGTGGKSSSGGKTSSGGGSAAGGAPEEYYDPALIAACGLDGGADECHSCLAARCCAALKACSGEAKCDAAFVTYQACERDPAEVDKSGCYSRFLRTVRGDSGVKTHEPLLACIITSCNVCGGPDVF